MLRGLVRLIAYSIGLHHCLKMHFGPDRTYSGDYYTASQMAKQFADAAVDAYYQVPHAK